MNKIKVLIIAAVIVGVSSSGYAFSAKYSTPNWDFPQGKVTVVSKEYKTSVPYTPNLNVNYDKQHISWAKSTLKPVNLR